MSPLLLSMSVEREIKARIVGKFKCREFIYLGNTVLIIELKSKEETVELTDVCDKFCKWVNRVIGAVVTAGIGMYVITYQILIIRMMGQGRPYLQSIIWNKESHKY